VETIVRRSVCFAAIGLLAASGCFSGSYEEAYSKSVDRYLLHKEPSTLPGERLLLHSPRLLSKDYEQSEPPILKDLPGESVSYSWDRSAQSEKIPAVLSVWLVTDEQLGFDAIKTKLSGAFPKAEWNTKEVETEDGGTVPWSMLKLVENQPVNRIIANIPEEKETACEIQVWVSSSPESKASAVLAWRLPEELTAELRLDKLAAIVAGTVRLVPIVEPTAVPDPAQDPAPASK